MTNTLAKKPAPNLIDQMQLNFVMGSGRNMQMSGIITWQFVTFPDGTFGLVPKTAPGIFRIN